MKNMKKLLVLTMLALLAFTAFNGYSQEKTSLFNKNELSLNLGFNYSDAIVNQEFAPTVGVGYFFTKNLGVRASTTLNVSDVKTFNNGEFVALARVPLFWIVAPYAGGGVRYNSGENEKFSPVIVGGVEAKVNKHWSLFAEAQHDFADKNVNFNDWSFRGGLKVIFW